MGTANAYSVFYQALHGALLSSSGIQDRLASLGQCVKDSDSREIPDEQIRKRFADFLDGVNRYSDADESLGVVLTDEEAAGYLEQALSLFGAIAIVYGHEQDE